MMPRLVAVHGPAQAGKDTVGQYLASRYGFTLMSFAGPLKAGLAAMIPGWAEHLAHKEREIIWLGKSPRELMQTLGTEWGRDMVHSQLWLTIAELRLGEMRHAGIDRVAITDCRFANEAQWVRNMGGSVWHIRREAAPAVRAHASEMPVLFDAKADWVINNNDSLDALHTRVDDILYELAKRRSAA